MKNNVVYKRFFKLHLSNSFFHEISYEAVFWLKRDDGWVDKGVNNSHWEDPKKESKARENYQVTLSTQMRL